MYTLRLTDILRCQLHVTASHDADKSCPALRCVESQQRGREIPARMQPDDAELGLLPVRVEVTGESPSYVPDRPGLIGVDVLQFDRHVLRRVHRQIG